MSSNRLMVFPLKIGLYYRLFEFLWLTFSLKKLRTYPLPHSNLNSHLLAGPQVHWRLYSLYVYCVEFFVRSGGKAKEPEFWRWFPWDASFFVSPSFGITVAPAYSLFLFRCHHTPPSSDSRFERLRKSNWGIWATPSAPVGPIRRCAACARSRRASEPPISHAWMQSCHRRFARGIFYWCGLASWTFRPLLSFETHIKDFVSSLVSVIVFISHTARIFVELVWFVLCVWPLIVGPSNLKRCFQAKLFFSLTLRLAAALKSHHWFFPITALMPPFWVRSAKWSLLSHQSRQ